MERHDRHEENRLRGWLALAGQAALELALRGADAVPDHAIVIELVNNARRAGATRIDIQTADDGGRRTISVYDDGCGIRRPDVVTGFGATDWPDNGVTDNEAPDGVGLFTLAGRRTQIETKFRDADRYDGWSATITPYVWVGRAHTEIQPAARTGTTVTFESLTGVKAWALAESLRYVNADVRIDGKAVERAAFMPPGEPLATELGCRFAAVEEHGRNATPFDQINIHGVVRRLALYRAPDSSRRKRGTWARVEADAAPGLQLNRLRPTEPEIIENHTLREIERVAARVLAGEATQKEGNA